MNAFLFAPENSTKLGSLSRDALETLAREYEKVIVCYQAENAKLKSLVGYKENQKLELDEQLVVIKHKVFGRSSERRPEASDIEKASPSHTSNKLCLPSLRYPDLPLVESEIEIESPMSCKCGGGEMKAMGATENSEYVTVVQKTYHVIRQKRHKYRCSKCHAHILTANAPKRIKSGSSFSNEMMIDVAVAKYADHVPVERYVQIARREGLKDIKANTLIDLTHYVADIMQPIYEKIRDEAQSTRIILADETWWRMMEHDPKKRWQLWGFFNEKASYYEAHDTRAGEVAGNFLRNSNAKFIISDVFSGYAKCTKGTGVKNCYCNAHARRKFIEAEMTDPDLAGPVIEFYKELYKVEAKIRPLPPNEKREHRQELSKAILSKMLSYVSSLGVLPKSSLGRAQSYMLKNWDGLTEFLNDGEIPIDNNQAERSLRSPVLGRKNFYGNHSPKGAKTSAILYTIMQTCKQNEVNPQDYLNDCVKQLLNNQAAMTPHQYRSAAAG